MAKPPSPPPVKKQEDVKAEEEEEEEEEALLSSQPAYSSSTYPNPNPSLKTPSSPPTTSCVYQRRVRRRTFRHPRFPFSKKARCSLKPAAAAAAAASSSSGGSAVSSGGRVKKSTADLDGVILAAERRAPPSSAMTRVVEGGGELKVRLLAAAKKRPPRSAEMVRATCKSSEDRLGCHLLARRARITFQTLLALFLRSGKFRRPDLKAAELMCDLGLWLHRDRRIVGPLPGSLIGDIFFYRSELQVVGLHGLCQGGIDFIPASRSSSGEPIATSIVVSGGYEDDEDHGDQLIYTGQGGKARNRPHLSADQQLTAGNLALQYNEQYGIEIRVIRGLTYEGSPSGKVYVYDGLYTVHEHWRETTKSGFTAYKFCLRRVEGQKPMGSSMLKLAEALKACPLLKQPKGYLCWDISRGEEKVTTIPLFNDIDDCCEPLSFGYLVKPHYPIHVLDRDNAIGSWGCRCTSICSSNCHCAKKNGGQFAYDANGVLLKGKPLIYECGSWCRCPQSCPNRVSQRGIRHRLEVFRSREMGWGVRSLDLIRAGSFVCEFSGVVLPNEVIPLDGSCLLRSNQFPARWWEWGDVSDVFPDHRPPDFPPLPRLSFMMDLSRSRNVACYISHSFCPNLFVQFVLYDHHNELYPHLMLFAMENIPPLTELSIDHGI
ncbi:hypothetical protein BHM03_00040253 [Ensete ventricosum]|nr:hypothetical protein BHM03_00040253 [Ensete ventricosum]